MAQYICVHHYLNIPFHAMFALFPYWPPTPPKMIVRKVAKSALSCLKYSGSCLRPVATASVLYDGSSSS